MQLKNFDVETFLRDHWQQKPLLIRNPWREWTNPIEPDELAGLACEDGVEARLVIHRGGQWKLEHGPFPEARFAKLPKQQWTLLVQAVDHYVPEVAALIEPFRFLPNWRIDDVMVSYAAPGGGVGPHFDHYDVFLIQGLGRRRWRVGPVCDAATPLLPHAELRLLPPFEASDEWLLEPGDILYLPPGYAHDGAAVGDDCMTYSIGFRAPARSELIAHWCDHILSDLRDDDRYRDPQLRPAQNPGEIGADALATLRHMALEKLRDEAAFARWFGRYATTRKYADHDIAPAATLTSAQLRKRLRGGAALTRNGASRFAFAALDGVTQLFVDGEAFVCDEQTAPLAEQLCAQTRISPAAAMLQSDAAATLLTTLINQGSLEFADDD